MRVLAGKKEPHGRPRRDAARGTRALHGGPDAAQEVQGGQQTFMRRLKPGRTNGLPLGLGELMPGLPTPKLPEPKKCCSLSLDLSTYLRGEQCSLHLVPVALAGPSGAPPPTLNHRTSNRLPLMPTAATSLYRPIPPSSPPAPSPSPAPPPSPACSELPHLGTSPACQRAS